jgi:hypothetical protein
VITGQLSVSSYDSLPESLSLFPYSMTLFTVMSGLGMARGIFWNANNENFIVNIGENAASFTYMHDKVAECKCC